jgi:nucleotide-binding universal stress UspA family protein
MFKKILVAIDRSAMGKFVFTNACNLAKAMGANLMLLHVLSPYEEDYPNVSLIEGFNYYPDQFDNGVNQYLEKLEQFKQESAELLEDYTHKALTMGVSAEFMQTTGNPGYTICEMAITWNADLIIIGHRGHSNWQELILGSVSNYVTHNAQCSVLTVQEHQASSFMSDLHPQWA